MLSGQRQSVELAHYVTDRQTDTDTVDSGRHGVTRRHVMTSRHVMTARQLTVPNLQHSLSHCRLRTVAGVLPSVL